MISFGVNNLMDKSPPFTVEDGVGNNNTISGPQDEMGRYSYTPLHGQL